MIEIKPRSISIDLHEVEKAVRQIKMEGLEWAGQSKTLPIAFGLNKLQMGCVIVDDLISTDDLIERIECIGLTLEQVSNKKRVRN